MSNLNIEQKSIYKLLSDSKADFLIPDYQRPYAWGEDECATLWDDLSSFAFPNDDSSQFNSHDDEYFLGPIVTFENNGKQEIIDGQQRLTTIMLLLRAFYEKFQCAKDPNTEKTRDMISQCIWKTDEFGNPNTNELKIDSEVASDDDKAEFLSILRGGTVQGGWKSSYAKNFKFFQERIRTFVSEYSMYTALLPVRILNNVILLPIEAESQDTALRIFSTLNDRGLPLSDADIFKSQFYRHFSDEGRKDDFIERWKALEESSGETFCPQSGTPMDELFSRYMYFQRARQGNRSTTTEALRGFYERNGYELLKKDRTLDDLEALMGFWKAVAAQDGFSDRVLRRFFVLNYAPNGMWTYLTSVYFLQNRGADGELDEERFHAFLDRTIAFVFAYAIERPGVNALRAPVYPEMINIVRGKEVTFGGHRFDRKALEGLIRSYTFTNNRPITKSMLAWWAFNDPDQPLIGLDTRLEIEHIYARKRAERESGLRDIGNLETLGNKALLESRINIRATDYGFADKKKYYLGFTDAREQTKEPTKVHELVDLASKADDFTEQDIRDRNDRIIGSFLDYVGANGLLE